MFFSSLTPYSYNTMLSPDFTIQKAAGDVFANAGIKDSNFEF
jgi:hypothetical protein